jgi:hypothetical protein
MSRRQIEQTNVGSTAGKGSDTGDTCSDDTSAGTAGGGTEGSVGKASPVAERSRRSGRRRMTAPSSPATTDHLPLDHKIDSHAANR